MGAQQRRPRRVAATLVHAAMAVWSLSLSVADLAHAVANGHAVGPGVMGQTFSFNVLKQGSNFMCVQYETPPLPLVH